MDHPTAILVAERFVHLRNGERALEALESARADEAETWLWRANAFHVLERYDNALECARAGLELDAESPYLHMAAARAQFASARFAEAEPEVREALRIAPHYADAHSLLALILSATRRPVQAAKVANEASKLAPAEDGVRLVEAFLKVYHGNYEAADLRTRALLAELPASAEAHWLRGVALARMMRMRAAAKHFREAATLDPGNDLFARSARCSGHWLLWPMRMTAPAGFYLAWLAVLPALNSGVLSGDWRFLGYLVAYGLYALTGTVAVLALPARRRR